MGGKVSVPTVSNYVGFAEDAWLILTYDEETLIEDEQGTIEVVPCWKWLLGSEGNRYVKSLTKS